MELQHTFTVPAPLDRAWATLLDVEGIAPCFPGAALTGVDGDEFAGTVKVKLGPVSLQYAGKGRFVERDEATHTVLLEANGSDKRGNGTAGATVTARLEAAGSDTTRVVVDTDLKVTGRPAQFGRGVLQDVGGKIIYQFATCLASRMATEPVPTEAETAVEPEAATPPEAAAEPEAAATPDAPVSSGPATPEPAPAATRSRSRAKQPSSASSATAAAASSVSVASNGVAAEPSVGTDASSVPPAAGGASVRTATPTPRPAPSAAEPVAELDLGAVVLPTLIKRYGRPVVAGLAVLLVLWLVRRRRR